jgi:hypothetical protein
MLTNRKKQLFVTLLAVLSLFVSAVSACACSHHTDNQSVELAATSCHGAEPGEVKVETEKPPTPTGSFVGQDCACFVRTPVQVIASKAEQKRSKVADTSDDIASVEIVRFEVSAIADVNVPVFDRTSSYHSNPHLLSGPARAPPRL